MQESRLKDIACELLQQIEKTTKPASEVNNAYTRTHKFIGSKDRRYLTTIVWQVLRLKSRLNYCYPKATMREKLDLMEQNLPNIHLAPNHIQWEVPEWLIQHISQPEKELPALLETPDIILRANGNRISICKKLAEEGIETELTPLSPYGLILKKRINLNACQCYKDGLIEVQDEGSQLTALKTEVQPHQSVLDYCAGAGGKSLIFAQMMQDKGKILAHDVSERSLQELEKRARRANVHIIETTTNLAKWHKENPTAHWDFVVVDAPCSGTGTWRRCPDARWKLTQEQLQALTKKQASILQKASQYVSQNGKLVYITCSLTNDENIMQIRSFLKKNTAFKLCSHKQFSPYQTQTDGLFCAIMEKTRE